MTTSQIVKSNNRQLEKRLLNSVKELPKLVVNQSCVHDDAFNWQITELSQNQKSNLKNLLNEV